MHNNKKGPNLILIWVGPMLVANQIAMDKLVSLLLQSWKRISIFFFVVIFIIFIFKWFSSYHVTMKTLGNITNKKVNALSITIWRHFYWPESEIKIKWKKELSTIYYLWSVRIILVFHLDLEHNINELWNRKIMFIILVNILGFIPNWIHTGEYVSEKKKKITW
jgi:hypothetical protein